MRCLGYRHLGISWNQKSREQRMEESHATGGDEVKTKIGVNVAVDDDATIDSTLNAHVDENDHDCRGIKEQIEPTLIQHVMSFRIGVTKISSVHWSPINQDHLIVSFANSPEIHIYDIASDLIPLPCIRINNVERVSKLLFKYSQYAIGITKCGWLRHDAVWLCEVKEQRYTLPCKDKG